MAWLALAAAPPCTLPRHWDGSQAYIAGIEPITNVIALRRGRQSWNGAAADDETLRHYMRQVRRLEPRPVMQIDTTGMTCADVARLTAIVDSDGSCTPYRCRAYAFPTQRTSPPPLRR